MLKKYFTTFIVLVLGGLIALHAQVVTLTPSFPTQSDNVTITFDATKGNAALSGQTVVYAHTGVITNLSTSATDWRHVIGNWGTDDSRVKMTSIGNNKFQLTFNIATFYGITGTEKVQKLAFVFRNLDGSKVARNSDGSDIFTPISDGTFQLNLTTNPSSDPCIVYTNDTFSVQVGVSASSDITLLIDQNAVITQSNATQLDTFFTGAQFGGGFHWITALATNNGNTFRDSVAVIVRGTGSSMIGVAPQGTKDGINYINDTSVVLQLFAPQKSFVYVIGDFNNWQLSPAYEMTRTPDGNRYWIQLNGLTPGVEYGFQYSIGKNQLRVADPYADKFLDSYNDPYINNETYPNLKAYPTGKTTEYVSVFQTAQTPYSWTVSNFVKPASKKLVIYELLIRDFVGKHNYQTLIDTIAYLKRLGINAVELMPFNEFEGNESWGYNTAFYFAPDKYYGTKDKLKEFIDVCHANGMAVIMDMVLNHSFGQSSMVRMYFDQATGKPLNSPWFNADATHPFNVGYDFNHESIYTQQLVDTVLKYWVNEYKIDGYRFDLSKGFTQRNTPTDVSAWSAYDQSRINIWKRIADKFRPTCSDCYMILEHFADNSEEKALSDYGFMLWGNLNYAFNEATMGYASDLRQAVASYRGWSNPNLVVYAESHDEERLMYKNINFGSTVSGYNVKDTTTALARCEAAAVLLSAIPGPYMIWQFGELGYPYSINTCTDGSVNSNCRLANKPIRWDYLNQAPRKRLYDVYAAMNALKNTYSTFSTSDFSHSLASTIKTITLRDTTMDVLVLANMGTSSSVVNRTVTKLGWWYNYFSGDSIYFNNLTDTITLGAGKYQVLSSVRLTKPIVQPLTGLTESMARSFEFQVYPNPATNVLYVETLEHITSAELIDITGRTIWTGELDTNRSINTAAVKNGVYLLKLTNNKQSSSITKIVIHQ